MPVVVDGPPSDDEKMRKEWGNYERPGDISNMDCKDCFCALVFLALLGGLIAIAVLAFVNGKIWSLSTSWDTRGQYCGLNNLKMQQDYEIQATPNYTFVDLTAYPYLFFDAWDYKNQICVKECPTNSSDILIALSNPENRSEFLNFTYLSSSNFLASYYTEGEEVVSYNSHPILNRCVPEVNAEQIMNFKEFTEGFNMMMDSISLSSSLYAIWDLKYKILAVAGMSLAVAFVWIFLMRFMTYIIIYGVVICIPGILAVFGWWLFTKGTNMNPYQAFKANGIGTPQIIAIIIWVIALIVLLIIIFLFKKISTAVTVISLASKALGSNWIIIFTPLLNLLIALIFWAFISVSSVYLYTVADFEVRYNEERGVDRLEYQVDKTLQYFLIYNLVYLVFITVHIMFTNYYVASATVVDWYFSGQASVGCGCHCWKGYGLAFTKSLGTITISSLIMTPIYVLIIFLEYLDAKARSSNISMFIQFLIKCFKCCLYIFAKVVKYLNKTLLTASQIFNRNWFRSASVVADVIISDLIMTTFFNGVAFFILFLSKVAVASACSLVFCYWVDKTETGTVAYLAAAFFVFFLSYVISSFVLSAYENVIDVVFVCYQSEKAIPNYSTGESTKELHKTVKEFKKARLAENAQVNAEGPEEDEEEKETKEKNKSKKEKSKNAKADYSEEGNDNSDRNLSEVSEGSEEVKRSHSKNKKKHVKRRN